VNKLLWNRPASAASGGKVTRNDCRRAFGFVAYKIMRWNALSVGQLEQILKEMANEA